MEEKQVKETGGRKRKNLVKFYLNDEENKKLCENAETFGRDKSRYQSDCSEGALAWICGRA